MQMLKYIQVRKLAKEETRSKVSEWLWLGTAFLLGLSYLLPTHQQPWTTFYQQAVAAVALSIYAVGTAFGGLHVSLDRPALTLLAISVIPLLQFGTGKFPLPGEAAFLVLYLLGISAAYIAARQATIIESWRLADAVFAALVFSGLMSSAMAVIQWQDLNVGGVMVAPPAVGGRSMANIGQPNMLSTLLVWSLLGLWWFNIRGNLSSPLLFLAGALLVLGMAATQSRTGVLQMFGLSVLAVWSGLRFKKWSACWVMLGLVIIFAILTLSWSSLNNELYGQASLTLQQMAAAGKRPQIWAMMLTAVLDSPWTGYGWNQGLLAFVSQVLVFPAMHVVAADAHNLIIDLMVWNGAPIGVSIAGAIFLFWLWLGRRIASCEELVLFGAAGIFLCHAMTEIPHAYANFSLPAAVMFGCLAAGKTAPLRISMSRGIAAFLSCTLLLTALLLVYEYQQIEADHLAYRVRAARIGDLQPVEPPKPVVLMFLQNALGIYRKEAADFSSEANVDELRRTVKRYPSVRGLMLLTEVEYRRGNRHAAEQLSELVCKLYPDDTCHAARAKLQPQ